MARLTLIFRLQVFHEQYGMREYARTKYNEDYRACAELCTECQACMERCPAQLDIPALLKKAHEVLTSEI